MNHHPSRRAVMKNIIAGGLVTAASDASAQPATTKATRSTTPSTTRNASQPATAPADLTVADVAAADRVAGRDYIHAEQEMMRGGLVAKRELLKSLRKQSIPPNVEPAVRFDPRLADTKQPPGPSRFRLSAGAVPEYNGNPATLAFASAAHLSRLIHAKQVTSLQLTQMYLERLKSIGPKLNCVITLTEPLAIEQAKRADAELAAGNDRGALHGMPYGVKDLLATKGIATTWGAQPYATQVFDEDATVVRKLEEAGAVLLAKLSLGELAMGDVWFGGLTRNPWQPDRGSGGSSAGPASATAAGLVGFSIGSETLGSIVNPCTICGTIGLRPTYGRVSRYGAMPLAPTMDKIGALTRGVEDGAMVLHAIHGADPRDLTAADVPFAWDGSIDLTSVRVGVDAAAFDPGAAHFKDEAVKSVYFKALETLRALMGRDLVPVKLPPPAQFTGLASLIIAAESASSFTELLHSGRVRELKQQGEGSWPNTFRIGSTIPASDYLRAMQMRTLLQREMAAAMKDVDLYVTIPYVGPTIAYTNLTGHPSLVTRCGMPDGRPRMIEFIGGLYREDAILGLAHQYEAQNPFNSVWPSQA